jgi:hypothetical protein
VIYRSCISSPATANHQHHGLIQQTENLPPKIQHVTFRAFGMITSVSSVPSGRYRTTREDPHLAAQTAPSASMHSPSKTPPSKASEVANVRSLLRVPASCNRISAVLSEDCKYLRGQSRTRGWSFVENRCNLAARHQPFVEAEEGDIHMILLSGLHPMPLLQPTSSLIVVTFPSASYLVNISTARLERVAERTCTTEPFRFPA